MTHFIRIVRRCFVAVAIALVLATLIPEASEAGTRPKKNRAAKSGKSRNKAVARKGSRRSTSARSRKGGKTRYVRSKGGRRGRVTSARGGRGLVKYVRYKRGRNGRRIRYVVYGRPRTSTATAYTAPVAPRVPPRVQIPEDRVREIQQALKNGGYYQGEITGEYDPATKEAMTSFQRANGIKETGMPTAQALMKLGLTRKTAAAGDTSAPGTPSGVPDPQKPPQPDNR